MKSKNVSSSSSGIGLTSVLTIVFVVLKLVGVIDWSWWLVLLPSIIGVSVSLILLAIVAIIIWKF